MTYEENNKGAKGLMIKINKAEKEYLLSKGCIWHDDIHASTTRKHYYATESPRVKKLLNKYYQEVTVKSEFEK